MCHLDELGDLQCASDVACPRLGACDLAKRPGPCVRRLDHRRGPQCARAISGLRLGLRDLGKRLCLVPWLLESCGSFQCPRHAARLRLGAHDRDEHLSADTLSLDRLGDPERLFDGLCSRFGIAGLRFGYGDGNERFRAFASRLDCCCGFLRPRDVARVCLGDCDLGKRMGLVLPHLAHCGDFECADDIAASRTSARDDGKYLGSTFGLPGCCFPVVIVARLDHRNGFQCACIVAGTYLGARDRGKSLHAVTGKFDRVGSPRMRPDYRGGLQSPLDVSCLRLSARDEG